MQEHIEGTLFEFLVSGTSNRSGRCSSSSKRLEKKVTAYGKGEIYNNPSSFGFTKVFKVVEIH